LYDCFNHADLLISDISSVVPDFVASGKPYVVTNPADEPHEEIRIQYPSTAAAYLADPEPAAWEPMLQLIETVDPMADRRAQLRTDLLGPRLEHPVDRWNEALDDLIRRAREQWPLAEAESAADEHA
jgi:CDP-glycerol glycerophosphotransferase (TagB/SpsB family)